MPINKIKDIKKIEKRKTGQEGIEITIKNSETGEIVYQNESLFGLLYSSELIMNIGLEVEDRHQILAWGNVAMWPYAVMMLKEKFKESKDIFFKSIDELEIPQNEKDLIKKYFEKLV